eukprot:g6084.t1
MHRYWDDYGKDSTAFQLGIHLPMLELNPKFAPPSPIGKEEEEQDVSFLEMNSMENKKMKKRIENDKHRNSRDSHPPLPPRAFLSFLESRAKIRHPKRLPSWWGNLGQLRPAIPLQSMKALHNEPKEDKSNSNLNRFKAKQSSTSTSIEQRRKIQGKVEENRNQVWDILPSLFKGTPNPEPFRFSRDRATEHLFIPPEEQEKSVQGREARFRGVNSHVTPPVGNSRNPNAPLWSLRPEMYGVRPGKKDAGSKLWKKYINFGSPVNGNSVTKSSHPLLDLIPTSSSLLDKNDNELPPSFVEVDSQSGLPPSMFQNKRQNGVFGHRFRFQNSQANANTGSMMRHRKLGQKADSQQQQREEIGMQIQRGQMSDKHLQMLRQPTQFYPSSQVNRKVGPGNAYGFQSMPNGPGTIDHPRRYENSNLSGAAQLMPELANAGQLNSGGDPFAGHMPPPSQPKYVYSDIKSMVGTRPPPPPPASAIPGSSTREPHYPFPTLGGRRATGKHKNHVDSMWSATANKVGLDAAFLPSSSFTSHKSPRSYTSGKNSSGPPPPPPPPLPAPVSVPKPRKNKGIDGGNEIPPFVAEREKFNPFGQSSEVKPESLIEVGEGSNLNLHGKENLRLATTARNEAKEKTALAVLQQNEVERSNSRDIWKPAVMRRAKHFPSSSFEGKEQHMPRYTFNEEARKSKQMIVENHGGFKLSNQRELPIVPFAEFGINTPEKRPPPLSPMPMITENGPPLPEIPQ